VRRQRRPSARRQVSGANELGIAFVLAQALIVAALAWFELVALRHGPQRNAARSAA